MARSGKNSKSSQAQPTGTGENGGKQAASGPVILSSPVESGGPVVSRIPPSIPIESSLVGQTETAIPAAAKKDAPASAPGDSPIPAVTRSALPEPAKPEPAKPESAKADTPKAETPKTETRRTAPMRTEVVRKGGFWPMLFGGVVAAGLGAGAAVWVMPQLNPAANAPEIDMEAVTARASEAGATAGAEAAEKAIAALPSGGEGADLQAELQTQAEKIAALEAALAARPEAAPAGGPAQAASTMPTPEEPAEAAPAATEPAGELAALRAELAAQAEKLAELAARPQLDAKALEQVRTLAADAGQVKAEIEAAAARAQESLSAVQSEADAATRRAQTVASVAALGAALEHGESPGAAVQQLHDAGVDVPEALATEDLPTLVQIQMGFDAVSRAALRESLKAESRSGGAMTAVGNFLRVQTGARSVEPREGADPDAVLSRAGALVDQGEIAQALEELSALPAEGQQAMADWTAQARAYLDAEAALNDVATTLN